jgi:hypothetical protein
VVVNFSVAIVPLTYTLKTSGLKNLGHLKMTQFGSNTLLPASWSNFGAILQKD